MSFITIFMVVFMPLLLSVLLIIGMLLARPKDDKIFRIYNILKRNTDKDLSNSNKADMVLLGKSYDAYQKYNQKEKRKASLNAKSMPIVSVYLINNMLSKIKAVILIFFGTSFIGSLDLFYFNDLAHAIIISTISALIYFLLFSDLFVIRYRITKGYFGLNKYEAKEVIKFILKNTDRHDDFKDPNGNVRVFASIKEEFANNTALDNYLNPSLDA
ncbi:hypothetical protein M0L20_14765 [Spirosoma sp. RP8]|uniref:Uncharacterized protein n=1 Tax=Spirosoma liriopis TaxID=2937440 RepID=A0ABT0HLS7_9BACT|nr:hypothetical protein [Spirosoma liriopis]MCK8493129.1 hypothetical protein [Spirosoma liriopis]